MERSGKVLDMTRGKPVRMILAFAIPLLIGNVFQQVYSMADTMVAGYCLGDRAIAAIGAMSALYSLIISMSVGLNSGFAVVVTQSFGAHDEGKLRKAIGGMMVLDAAITGLPDSVTSFVIDLENLDYISSAGLRVLVSTEKLASRRGGTMRLLHPNDEVNEVFEMTGLSEVFTIEA